MPDRDGLDLAREIRANPQLAASQIIMLSSMSRAMDAEQLRQLGVDKFLAKPIDQRELYDALVAASGQRQHASGPESAPASPVTDPATQALRILLAEDNLVNQKLAAHFLTRLGHHFAIAGNGLEALRLLAQDSWDLVLMDLQMPELDGEKATRLIREREAAASPPRHQRIIAMTAHAMKGDEEYCLQNGFDGYVAKPVSQEMLHQEIGRVMALPDPAADEMPAPPGDAAALAQQLGLDESLLRELLLLFAESLTEIETQLMTALNESDWTSVSRHCHKLRGEAAIFGFTALTRTLQTAETHIRQGDVLDAAQLREDLTQQSTRVRQQLRTLLEEN